MSQQGIYALCYGTKLDKLTFNYCTFLSSARLKGRLKMHFPEVECKSSSTCRSGVDPYLQLRGAKLCNGCLEAEAPKGSRGKAPGQGLEESP